LASAGDGSFDYSERFEGRKQCRFCVGAEPKLIITDDSKISFFRNSKEGVTLEMVLLMWFSK